jgi:hypothetical protein
MIESEKRQVKTGNFTFERSSLFAVRKFWKQENLVKTKKTRNWRRQKTIRQAQLNPAKIDYVKEQWGVS